MPSPLEEVANTSDLLRDRAMFIRLETLRLIEIAKVGHYSSVFSAAEIFATLYYSVMTLRPGDPAWPDRDRFLMGKGHAAVGLFPVLADLDFLPTEMLDDYTRLGSPLGDHPDMRKVPGIDFSSGSIGHALSNGIGMALGGRMDGRDYTVFVMLGDGEMQEGQTWEAAMAAGSLGLANLCAVVDGNGMQVEGHVDRVLRMEPVAAKWRAFGWQAIEVDGHDVGALLAAYDRARADREAPTVVLARTLVGKGVDFLEGIYGHNIKLSVADAEAALRKLGREGEPR